MLIYSPKWLFLLPGTLLLAAGTVGMGVLSLAPMQLGGVQLDVGAQLTAGLWMVLGAQLVSLAFFTKVFAVNEGLLNADTGFSGLIRRFTVERGIIVGLLTALFGAALFLRAVLVWKAAHFGVIDYAANIRRLIPAAVLVILGIQCISSSFFMGVLGLKTTGKPAAPAPRS